MIEMKVMGIAIDTASGSPIIVLNDKDNRKALPIWIGSAEASAIIRKIENIKVVRPMTHDLIIDVIEKTGFNVDRVEINDVEKDTYFSSIFLVNDDGKVVSSITLGYTLLEHIQSIIYKLFTIKSDITIDKYTLK